MITEKKFCTIKNCDNKQAAKSLCRKHYTRNYRFGRTHNIYSHSKHGYTGTPEYKAWRSMIDRCDNYSHSSYKNYGGRGIKVDKTFYDFNIFIKHIGDKPSTTYSLDRIDNNGHYEPGNVRWATRELQNNNKRCNEDRVYFKWQEAKNRWYVRKKVNGKIRHVGFFKTRIEAISVLQNKHL